MSRWIRRAFLSLSISIIANQVSLAGLVGHWSFDEPSGSTVLDGSVYGAHGTLNGSVNRVPGVFGSAVEFDSDGDFIEIPHYNQLNFSSGFTVAFWIKASTEQGGISTIIDKSHGSSNGLTGWAIQARDSEGGAISQPLGTGTGFPEPRTPGVLNEEWHHVALTVDAASGLRMKGYVDGVQRSDFTTSGVIANNGGDLIFGRHFELGRQFSGLLDEITLHDHVLTQGEIELMVPEPSTALLFMLTALFVRRRI